MQQVCVLGSTGSIGRNTLAVIARHQARFNVHSLVAGSNHAGLYEQVLAFRPALAVLADHQAAATLRARLAQDKLNVEVLSGAQGAVQAASDPGVDIVMAAITGAAGLLPTLAAIQADRKILLANKEALVMAGALFMDRINAANAVLLPVDSEHNAIFQCLPPRYRDGLEQVGVRRIMLTASGGPFRQTPMAALADVTPEQACAHPTWRMGRKISVDCATMVNKGLEVIEACWLFGADPAQVEVVIHPQSVVHSMVDYQDGSVLAQLGNPDMKTPISHALAWPDRVAAEVAPLSLTDVARLDFQAPCMKRYHCLQLAQAAATAGGTAATVFNAANEAAVAAFLTKHLRFDRIAQVIDATLQTLPVTPADSVEQVLAVDQQARDCATKYIDQLSHGV